MHNTAYFISPLGFLIDMANSTCIEVNSWSFPSNTLSSAVFFVSRAIPSFQLFRPKNLEFFLHYLNHTPHILSVFKYFWLSFQHVSRIWHFVSSPQLTILICTTIISHLNYCNNILPCLPFSVLPLLQSPLNIASRVTIFSLDSSWLPFHSE